MAIPVELVVDAAELMIKNGPALLAMARKAIAEGRKDTNDGETQQVNDALGSHDSVVQAMRDAG